MAHSASRPRRGKVELPDPEKMTASSEQLAQGHSPETIGLPVDMILNLLFKYLQNHPELIEQVMEKLIGRLVAAINDWVDSKAQS